MKKPIIKTFGDFTIVYTKEINCLAVQYKKKDIWVHINNYQVAFRVNGIQNNMIFNWKKKPTQP